MCAADGELEYKVKAAFLLNFARFTKWPANDHLTSPSHLEFCVIGDDPFGPALADIQNKEVGGYGIKLRYADSIDEIKQCQVLFVAATTEQEASNILDFSKGKAMITVSDFKGFAALGGIIEFRNKDGRLSFVINNSRAKENGLRISSSLLNLAIDVL